MIDNSEQRLKELNRNLSFSLDYYVPYKGYINVTLNLLLGVLLYTFALLGILGFDDDSRSRILQVVHGLPGRLDH